MQFLLWRLVLNQFEPERGRPFLGCSQASLDWFPPLPLHCTWQVRYQLVQGREEWALIVM